MIFLMQLSYLPHYLLSIQYSKFLPDIQISFITTPIWNSRGLRSYFWFNFLTRVLMNTIGSYILIYTYMVRKILSIFWPNLLNWSLPKNNWWLHFDLHILGIEYDTIILNWLLLFDLHIYGPEHGSQFVGPPI